MARIPMINEPVVPNGLVLNVETVRLSEGQFVQLCRDNPELRLELTARKALVIMPPAGLNSSWRNNILCYRLTDWAMKDGTGVVFESSAGYVLPDGAIRGPEASWIHRERLEAFSAVQLEKFAHICPDFVCELMSPTDTIAELQNKMTEYIANGARLGWLIDPFEAQIHIYRPGQPVECLERPSTIGGEPVLPGFIFNVAEIWGQ